MLVRRNCLAGFERGNDNEFEFFFFFFFILLKDENEIVRKEIERGRDFSFFIIINFWQWNILIRQIPIK